MAIARRFNAGWSVGRSSPEGTAEPLNAQQRVQWNPHASAVPSGLTPVEPARSRRGGTGLLSGSPSGTKPTASFRLNRPACYMLLIVILIRPPIIQLLQAGTIEIRITIEIKSRGRFGVRGFGPTLTRTFFLHPILRFVLARFRCGELACAGHGITLNSAIDA